VELTDNRIILWGQSCSGKTHFAQQFSSHQYLCFDHLFRWHEIETLDLSCSVNLKHIAEVISSCDKCILDGWHLTDPSGELAPVDSVFYVIYASYDRIISQYRVPVARHDEHYHMFQRWYGVDFTKFKQKLRYFFNTGVDFVETEGLDFEKIVI
jgi:hypothetical protein